MKSPAAATIAAAITGPRIRAEVPNASPIANRTASTAPIEIMNQDPYMVGDYPWPEGLIELLDIN
jgi:hypothetical protein